MIFILRLNTIKIFNKAQLVLNINRFTSQKYKKGFAHSFRQSPDFFKCTASLPHIHGKYAALCISPSGLRNQPQCSNLFSYLVPYHAAAIILYLCQQHLAI